MQLGPYFYLGDLLTNGKLYHYESGTTTLKHVYSDRALTTTMAQPLTSDSNGLFDFYADGGAYKFVLTDTNDSPISTWDGWDGKDFLLSIQDVSEARKILQINPSTLLPQYRFMPIQWVGDFGVVADGVTDDTAALTAFWQSAMANPGIPHLLSPATYAITSALPEISVSGTWLECVGYGMHDVGSLYSGAIIKWISMSNPTNIQVIQPPASASGPRLSDIKFKGICFDCQGVAATGIYLASIFESEIWTGAANAATAGGIVTTRADASLGEATDSQKNQIRWVGRQIETPGGTSLFLTGDADGNTSMNEFWIDVAHMNGSALACVNTDNNDFRFVRAYRATGGTATEAISLFGNNTSDTQTCRGDRFHYVTAVKADGGSYVSVHAYGTGTYTYPTHDCQIFCLDTLNGTTVPTVDTGATCYWRADTSPLDSTPYVAFTPVVTSQSGSIGAYTATGWYAKRGAQVSCQAEVTITTKDTAGGYLQFTIPAAIATHATAAKGAAIVGVERANSEKMVVGYIDSGGATSGVIYLYDGSTPFVADGDKFVFNWVHEV